MSDHPSPSENPAPAMPPSSPGGETPPPSAIAPAAAPQKRRGKTPSIILWVVVVVGLAVGIFFMMRGKWGKGAQPEATTPTVAVTTAVRGDLYNDVTIPGEFRPYVEAELNAKVTGYLQKINVDFGDKVKSGQLLAVLEVPELQAELNAAIATIQQAEADYTNAHLIFNRLDQVNREHPNLVAEQDIDNAQAKDSTAFAAVTAAKAEEVKFRTMFDYTQITAPFDGVITRRYADPGALIQAGTSSGSAPLVRVSDNYRLRLDFPVSVEYVKDIHLGESVNVRVDSLGGKTFTGTITRFTDRVSEDTRTMITELEVANPSLEIVPGMYAVTMLKVQARTNVLTIPTEAVATGAKNTVYTVNQNNEIEEHTVALGLETPNRYEVTSGLKEGDRIMIGNHSQVHAGEKVETKPWVAVSME